MILGGHFVYLCFFSPMRSDLKTLILNKVLPPTQTRDNPAKLFMFSFSFLESQDRGQGNPASGSLMSHKDHALYNFVFWSFLLDGQVRKLEKAVAVRNSLLEKFSGKFRRCWQIRHRFSDSPTCNPCQGFPTLFPHFLPLPP